MSWDKVKLADCCLSISDGDHQPPPKAVSGVPFVTIANINKSNQFDFSDTMFVPKDYYDRLDSKRKAQVGDILYSVVGSFGIPVLIKEERPFVFQRHIAILRPNGINSAFLYYTMLSRDFYAKADAAAIGAAQRTVSLTSLRGMEIELPPLKVQEAIASKLSVYDNLIENNQKQIKILEEAARRLYKEWFVDLRFPGYEDTPIVDGVPEGWKKCLLGDINCSLESGSRPKGGIDASLVDGVPSIGAENVIGLGCYNYSSEKLITKDFFSKMKRGKLCDKDILIYKDGAYIGRTSLFQDGFPHLEAAVNEHVFLLHAADEHIQYYLFFTLYQQEYYQKMQKLNKNAAQPGINSKAMMSLPVLLPTEDILDGFDSFATPLMHKIFNLAKQNRRLELARDRLLPKLMSGEIEV